MSCSAASACTPSASASFASALSSFLNRSVSPGSTSFSLNLPLVIRNRSASLRASLISRFVFTRRSSELDFSGLLRLRAQAPVQIGADHEPAADEDDVERGERADAE